MQPLYVAQGHYISALVIIFALVGLAMLALMLFLSWAVRPLRQRPRAQQTYECGYPAKGDSRAIGFNHLNYAVLFLVFDVAAIYLFLYAYLAQPPAGVTVSMLLGIITLGIIVLYGTKKRRYYVT